MKSIYTIGSSTRRLKELVEALRSYGVKRLVDVRHYPTSSRFPHFKRERLEKSLPRHGIEYLYLGELLGGFRPEGYEAYAKSKEFEEGIKRLEVLAAEKRCAFMCAEKLFWRCHRRFISRELRKRGWRVFHIVEAGRVIKDER